MVKSIKFMNPHASGLSCHIVFAASRQGWSDQTLGSSRRLGGQLVPYVVKPFGLDLIEKNDSVTREVLGNVLAPEFGLRVPEAAFIDLDENFRSSLREHYLLEQLENGDERLKFGSKLLEGYYRFDPSVVSPADASKMIEIDTLFAFDNLIRNPDRNSIKPNLLVRSDDAFLIDHELGFEIDANSIDEIHNWSWKEKFYRYHIFYDYLRKSPSTQKRHYFDEFAELLRLYDPHHLGPYFDQLEALGYPRRNQATIIDYLSAVKQNSSNFVAVLKGKIS